MCIWGPSLHYFYDLSILAILSSKVTSHRVCRHVFPVKMINLLHMLNLLLQTVKPDTSGASFRGVTSADPPPKPGRGVNRHVVTVRPAEPRRLVFFRLLPVPGVVLTRTSGGRLKFDCSGYGD